MPVVGAPIVIIIAKTISELKANADQLFYKTN
jgi:hypothetical protein